MLDSNTTKIIKSILYDFIFAEYKLYNLQNEKENNSIPRIFNYIINYNLLSVDVLMEIHYELIDLSKTDRNGILHRLKNLENVLVYNLSNFIYKKIKNEIYKNIKDNYIPNELSVYTIKREDKYKEIYKDKCKTLDMIFKLPEFTYLILFILIKYYIKYENIIKLLDKK